MKSTTIIMMMAVCAVAYAQQCTYDYQCGTQPYGLCASGADDCSTTFPGVAVDGNDIYYAVSCRAQTSSTYGIGNVTIKRVSANGGVPTTIFTQELVSGPGNIDKIFAVVNGVIYVDRALRQPGSHLGTYDTKSNTFGDVYLNPGFFQGQLDIVGGASYTCQAVPSSSYYYEVTRYSGAVGQTGSNTVSGNRLYNSTIPCGPVRRGINTEIIFTTINRTYTQTDTLYSTTFYRGSVTGSTTLPAPLFTVNSLVNDFDVDSTGAIIYGTSSGLFKRVGATSTKLNSESVTGVQVLGQKIFYNNGVTIRSAALDGSGVATVPQPTTGTCTCRAGFSESNCQTCRNGQVQWNNGIPSCVPVDSNGVPASCSADYNCPSSYYVCAGQCICRKNFSGPKCDQCAGTVTWSTGVPTCSA